MSLALRRLGGLLTLTGLLAACARFRVGCQEDQMLVGKRCVADAADVAAESRADAADVAAESGADAADVAAESGADAADAAAESGVDAADAAAESGVDAADAADVRPPICGAGTTTCGGACVNTMSDSLHCGGCGRACDADRLCRAGLCVPLQRSCASSSTAGCGMRRFAGGTFTQGEVMALAASPTMMMTVSPFAIDAYEVTVARFRVFWAERRTTAAPEAIRAMPIAYRGGAIAWGDPAQPPLPLDSQCNWSDTDSRVTAHPMNCLDYWLAQEFCVWDGGRLPTEAEWEFAARGSAADGLVPGRIFPWGDTAPSCDRVHFTGCSGEDGRRTRQVGRFAATAGLFDMAGNVWEWIADNYLEYPMCRGSGIDVLCSYSPTANRVFRGGSRSSDATSIRAASRFDFSPVLRNGAFGFRCARDTAL